jgi:DNA-binding NtrC family response regulator
MSALTETLLASELFGHEKGAFTGATGRRIGKFEEAHGGTLLLDEVTEMHISLQAKLLRALQEREITRVGSNDSVKVDVRIIATSNRDLQAAVDKKEFREDLYFRLNVVNIALPALRERPQDIVTLGQFFADKYADANSVGKKKLSDGAKAKLTAYGWRGNIRELENTMHRAILVSMQDELEPDAIHIQESAFSPGAPTSVKAPAAPANNSGVSRPVQNPGAVEGLIGKTIADVERDMIINTLEHCLGNRTHAANILGISIRTLRNKLHQYKDEGVNVPAAAAGGD